MAQGTLFSMIGQEISKELTLSHTRAKAKVEQGARATFDKIVRDFDLRFIVEEIRDPRRDCLRKQMKELVDSATAEINGPIAMDLARAQTETLG